MDNEGVRDGSRRVAGRALLMPNLIGKVMSVPAIAWLIAAILALVDIVLNDGFFWVWSLLIVANVADWISGRWAARHRGEFDPTRSREGLYSKAIGLVVVALLRSVEAMLPHLLPVKDLLPAMGEKGTDGLFAVAITFLLIYEDIESLDRHRQELGAAPIPLVTFTIRKLREITGSERRVGMEDRREEPGREETGRREDDDHEEEA